MNVWRGILYMVGLSILVYCSICFDYDALDYSILIANCVLVFILLCSRAFAHGNIANLIFSLYILLALNLYSLFEFPGLMGECYAYEQREALARYGNIVMFFYLSTATIGNVLFAKTANVPNESLHTCPMPSAYVYAIVGVGAVLSVASYILGIGRLGVEGTRLPFKLNGIIQTIRTDIYPLLFLLIFARNSKDPRLKYYLLLFFCWGMLETYITLSKSRLLFIFLPLALYYIIVDFPQKKMVRRSLIPIALVFVLIYPIVGALRYVKTDTHLSYQSMQRGVVVSDKINKERKNHPLIQIYNRMFMAGQHYMNAYETTKNDAAFDFSRTSHIVEIGGSAVYETRYIEKIPASVVHSSGTTGITDALLLGGEGLSYVIVVMLTLCAFVIDRSTLCRRPLYKVFFLLIFIDLVRARTISMFLDVLLLSFVTAKLIEILLIWSTYSKSNLNLSKV